MNLQDFKKLYNYEAPKVNTSMWEKEDWVRYITNNGKRKKQFYVSMIDKFMSNWGCAENKLSVYLIICDTFADALQIMNAANKRTEMHRIKLHKKLPIFNSKKYRVDTQHFSELGSVWTGLPTKE
jgi:hypothetical protein